MHRVCNTREFSNWMHRIHMYLVRGINPESSCSLLLGVTLTVRDEKTQIKFYCICIHCRTSGINKAHMTKVHMLIFSVVQFMKVSPCINPRILSSIK